MGSVTRIRQGESDPASLARKHLYVKHDAQNNNVLAVFAGSKNDIPKVVRALAVVTGLSSSSVAVPKEAKRAEYDTSGNAVTASLPAPKHINDGHEIDHYDAGGNAGTNAITINDDTGTTVTTISTNNGSAKTIWDAENATWIVR